MLDLALGILDTAVKIGLGALISGIITYHVSKLAHERELHKIFAVRRLDSLARVSEKVESFFHCWRSLAACLGGTFKGAELNIANVHDERKRKLLVARDKAFVDSTESLHQVIATLRLLGATKAADALLDVAKRLGQFRDPLFLHNEVYSSEHFKSFRQDIREVISAFHTELSNLYLGKE